MSKEILSGKKFLVLGYDGQDRFWVSLSQPFKTIREARDFIESLERSGTPKGQLLIFKQTD